MNEMEQNTGNDCRAIGQKCDYCSTTWHPSRRSFVRGLLAVSAVGLPGGILTLVPKMAVAGGGEAEPGGLLPAPASGICEQLRAICLSTIDESLSEFQKLLLQAACEAEYIACEAQAAAAALADAINTGMQWLSEHPEVVIGTILLIGGILLIVTTGPGGALILVAL